MADAVWTHVRRSRCLRRMYDRVAADGLYTEPMLLLLLYSWLEECARAYTVCVNAALILLTRGS